MNKTLHKPIIIARPIATNDTVMRDPEVYRKALTQLIQEMRGYLQAAAADLLQPRPEAVRLLLQKALH